MRFNTNFIAVGVTSKDDETAPGVVVALSNMGNFTLNESGARKLADDLLRNANYLWPVADVTDEGGPGCTD